MFSRIKILLNFKPKLRRFSTETENLLYLLNRDFLHDTFPDNVGPQLQKMFVSSPQTIYAGFDPTADSLHIGNLLVIMGLLHCQRSGHIPIALIGGATGLIGDPSGRSKERIQLNNEIVEHNLSCIEKQIYTIFENHKKEFWFKTENNELRDIKVLNNAQWYHNLNLIDFISNLGRHFRMGSMLSRSSVQARITSSEGMSLTEFTYQVFQAYDWLHLLQNYNCRFQMGGNDQMGNIMTGHELISRVANKSVFGLTLPIITNEEGDKFGKSGGTPVWLDPHKTSEFSFYQYFVRVPDSEVHKLLKLFTFLTLPEIEDLMEEHHERPEARKAQKELAKQVTILVHGEEGFKKAWNLTNALYQNNIEGLSELNINDFKQTFGGATICEIFPEAGMTLIDLAMKAKCFKTESDACRIISAGGFYINMKRSQNISEMISPGLHMLKNGLTLLRVGKKNYYIIKWLM